MAQLEFVSKLQSREVHEFIIYYARGTLTQSITRTNIVVLWVRLTSKCK